MLKSFSLCSLLVQLIFVQLAAQQEATTNEAPIVETTLGKIRGSVLTSRKGRDFYSYRGIHYGKETSGVRRFAPPEPVEPWDGILEALEDGPTCPQAFPNVCLVKAVEINENCLCLNVHTPNITASNPVIVYIHGGVNRCGNAHSEDNARPNHLLDEDIVMVGVNFRIGAFGYLSTGTKEAPGNYAYLDQILALQWVQEHIADFGGDPNRVTLMGYSSGSHSVTALLASPLAAGLFHGVMAFSGSATSHSEIDNIYWTQRLAHEMGCPKFGPQYLLNCLRKFNWDELTDVYGRWDNYKNITNMRWTFEVDGNILVENPNDAVLNGRFNRVPIIVCITFGEFDFDFFWMGNNDDFLEDVNLNFALYTQDLFGFKTTGEDDELVKTIRQFYNLTTITKDNVNSIGLVKSDYVAGHANHRLVEIAKSYTNVYSYRFDYLVEASKGYKAVHGDDVALITPKMKNILGADSKDHFMVDRMIKMVSSFAANGVPVMANLTWTPYTADNKVVMYVDTDCYVGGPFNEDRFALWDKLFPYK